MILFLQLYITKSNLLSVSNFNHGEADHLIAHDETLLEHFHDLVLALFRILHVHDRVVESGVKLLAQALNLGDAQLLHGGVELGHNHLHTTAVGLVLGGLVQGPNQIVIHRQELFQGLGLDVGIETVLFLLAALAEIVILGAETQVLVVQGGILGRGVGFGLFRLRLLCLGFLGLAWFCFGFFCPDFLGFYFFGRRLRGGGLLDFLLLPLGRRLLLIVAHSVYLP